MNITPKQKIEDTYCINCKKYTGNSDMSSKTIKESKIAKSKMSSVWAWQVNVFKTNEVIVIKHADLLFRV